MKIKYNVKGVERGAGLRLVKGGVYGIKITEAPVTQPEGKGARIELKAVINDKVTNGGEFDGVPLRTYYVNLDRDDLLWKVGAVVDAFGLKDSGTFDDKTLVGKTARARVKSKMDEEWGPQNEIAALLPPDAEEEADEEEEETEEVEEEETEAETEEEDEGVTWTDLAAWNRDELKGFIKDAELGTLKDLGIKAATTDDEIRDIIATQLELGDRPDAEEEEEEEEPEETEEEEETVDLSSLDRTGLKALIKEQGLDVKVLKADSDDALRAKIAEATGATGDEEEEEEEEETESEAPDYNAMSVGDLRTMARERGLSDKGGKDVLVKRLKKDDEPF
jgi:hypothetical protein